MGIRILIGLGIFFLFTVAGLFWLGRRSQAMTPGLGLSEGALRPCPDSTNCVCSEQMFGPRSSQKIESFSVGDGKPAEAWRALIEAVKAEGGSVTVEMDRYLRAEFRVPVFGFVDDFEARLGEGAIEVRSASRVGQSDLGANRSRVERLRIAYRERLDGA